MSKETLKRKPEVSSELLASKIHGQDDKKIKNGTGSSGNQDEATRVASGQNLTNPVDTTK